MNMTSPSFSPDSTSVVVFTVVVTIPSVALWQLVVRDQTSAATFLTISIATVWTLGARALYRRRRVAGAAFVRSTSLDGRLISLIESSHLGTTGAASCDPLVGDGGLIRVAQVNWGTTEALYSLQPPPLVTAGRALLPRRRTAPVPKAGGDAGRPYLVQRGETYWSLAERVFEDGSRWTEIRDLNVGTTPKGSAALTPDHDRITAGWTISLPVTRPEQSKENSE